MVGMHVRTVNYIVLGLYIVSICKPPRKIAKWMESHFLACAFLEPGHDIMFLLSGLYIYRPGYALKSELPAEIPWWKMRISYCCVPLRWVLNLVPACIGSV